MTLEELGQQIFADIDEVVEKYKKEWLMDIVYDININFIPYKNEIVS